jgi:hypothetical protein
MKKILLCLCMCLCGAFACHAQYPELEPKEIEVLGIIRSAQKSMHVRIADSISAPIITELEIRRRYRAKGENRRKLEIMTGDTLNVARLMRAGASVWVNKEYAAKPEVLVVDESIVIIGFNNPYSQEIINDPALAKSYIDELKNTRRASKRMRQKAQQNVGWKLLGSLLAPWPKLPPHF